VQIFFLALFKEKVNNLLDQVNNSRISGIRPYRISGRAIWYSPDIGYHKRPDYPASRISGTSLLITAVASHFSFFH
jgi:hypothetical protein